MKILLCYFPALKFSKLSITLSVKIQLLNWPLKTGVGGKPWVDCMVVGSPTLSGILLHIIDSSSKCAHLGVRGTWGGKMVGTVTAHDSEVWRQESFLTCKAKKKKKKKKTKSRKRSHPYKPWKWKRHCLENQQQDSGCGNMKPALQWAAGGELWESGRYKGDEAKLLPKVF